MLKENSVVYKSKHLSLEAVSATLGQVLEFCYPSGGKNHVVSPFLRCS